MRNVLIFSFLVIMIFTVLFLYQPEINGNNVNSGNMNTDSIDGDTIQSSRDQAGSSENDMPDVLRDDLEIKTKDDGTRYIVDEDNIIGGGPPKDGIPSIDEPKFIQALRADEWLTDDELVIGIDHKNESRAYPFQILVFHEIVNDVIAGDPILVTYCPLCGSGIAYERKIDGEEVEFGTSGKLYNSNLVMYDRSTDTYWSQIGGLAIYGELTGKRLSHVSSATMSWKDWKERSPDTTVLSKDTGFSRPYGTDPYGNYYTQEAVMFPVENEDDRMHPKTVVYGVEDDGNFKAYKKSDLDDIDMIQDEIMGQEVTLKNEDGLIRAFDENGEELSVERVFWFSWYAFHPQTEVYGL